MVRKPVGLVLIHGAGKETGNYHKDFIQHVRDHLGHQPPFIAVWWSDLSDVGVAGRSGFEDPLQSPGALAFRQDFLIELGLVAAKRGSPAAGTRASRQLGETTVSLWDTATDVVRYFFDRQVRLSIQGRLLQGLEQANQLWESTVLASHSLGSVIAYDVLRRHAASYNTLTWFTTGCPLAKLVKLRQSTTEVGQIALPPAKSWQNLYDSRDVVASALGKTFPYPVTDQRVKNEGGILGSHNYWPNPSVASAVAKALERS